jgi:hypothetical protein
MRKPRGKSRYCRRDKSLMAMWSRTIRTDLYRSGHGHRAERAIVTSRQSSLNALSAASSGSLIQGCTHYQSNSIFTSWRRRTMASTLPSSGNHGQSGRHKFGLIREAPGLSGFSLAPRIVRPVVGEGSNTQRPTPDGLFEGDVDPPNLGPVLSGKSLGLFARFERFFGPLRGARQEAWTTIIGGRVRRGPLELAKMEGVIPERWALTPTFSLSWPVFGSPPCR